MIPIEVINELQNEIGAMESTILYFEKRILQKRVALWELIQSHASNTQPIRIELPPPPSPPLKHITLFEMISTILPEFNGGLISYRELRKKCVEKFPEAKDTIRGNFATACRKLMDQGKNIEPPPMRGRKFSNEQRTIG